MNTKSLTRFSVQMERKNVCKFIYLYMEKLLQSFLLDVPQVAQTHVAREGCNVIYITYVTRRCRVTDDR